jgi:Leucine-rich repeat (LRR) protein
MSAQNDFLAFKAFQLIIKFYSKNSNSISSSNSNNNNIMLLRLVCKTFNVFVNDFVLNNISTLNISCSFDPSCWETLRKRIRMMPNLTCLNLIRYNMYRWYDFYKDDYYKDDYDIIVTEPNLALFVQSTLSDLSTLKLTSLGIMYGSDEGNASLLAPNIAELTKFTSLTSLSLETPLALQLVPSVAGLTDLIFLKFEFNNIETPTTAYSAQVLEEMIRPLAQTLCSLSNLTDLDLGNNRLEDSHIRLLASSLERLTDITSINLEANHIKDHGMELLAGSIYKMPNLTSVNFGCNNIRFSYLDSFLSSLDKLKLTDLNLSHNFINDGVYVFLASLAKQTHLISLNIEGCYFRSSETARDQLEQTFAKLTNLRCLNLSSNNFEVFAGSLVNLTNLTKLDLINNCLGSDEISLLAPSLMRMTSMTYLNLKLNQIRGLAGAQSLIPILRGMKHLKFLKIDWYELGKEGKALLLDFVKEMPKLNCDFI